MSLVDRALRTGAMFMRSQGLLHFDAHFRNVLTDGHRLYFADFGLATWSRFSLDASEVAFFRQHVGYDRYYTASFLATWLVVNLLGVSWTDCRRYLGEIASGRRTVDGLADPVRRILDRYAAVAAVMGDFLGALHTDSKSTPYPVARLRQALRR